MPHVLVIGAGYLGSCLGKQLAAAGYPTTIASKSGKGHARRADVESIDSLSDLQRELKFSPDWIVHCASSGRGGPVAYRSVFLEGNKNLGTVFPDTPIIFTSSTSVYHQTDGSMVTEESPTDPDRETGRILRESESLVSESGGVVARLAGIYGPGRSIYLQRILQETATIESGPVSRWLNQIHRDDAAHAIVHLLKHGEPGEIYNVCDDSPISQRKCYEELSRILNLPVPPESPPDLNRKRAWTHKRVSNAKLRSTGWAPLYTSFICALSGDKRLLPSIEEQVADQE